MEIQSENLEQVKEEFKDLKGRAKAAKRAMRQSKADKAEKNSKFAATLSQLRRERGISQKKAAGDLGISQALLSHYEKGIRECGLDFVVKCADYYGVTTDYLLGLDNREMLYVGELGGRQRELLEMLVSEMRGK